jgi:tRNA (cmo5U34)-methyltransferase
MSEDWMPETYLDDIRIEIPRYDELQGHVAEATRDLRVGKALELGVGTGETARRLLTLHRSVHLVGVDGSPAMLEAARATLPVERVDLRLARLEDALPRGPFDLVVSVLAVHHLRGKGKADLFRRIAAALRPGGRFVLGDLVVPEGLQQPFVSIEEEFDFPDRLGDQLSWLAEAGFSTAVFWRSRDLAVVQADLQPSA